jgi:outer membrane receptor protein involved in Fe transport
VRVITNKADVSGFDASLQVDGASTDHGGLSQRYSGMVNIPISERSALRLVGYVRDEEGYIENVGTFGLTPVNDENDADEWGVRASFRWEPTDASSLVVGFMRDDIQSQSLGDFQQPSLGDFKRATFRTEDITVETENINVTYEHDFSWGQLVSSTTFASAETYWDLDLNAIFGPFMPFGYNEGQDQDALVQELRLVSALGGKFEWIAGAFYLDRETKSPGATYTTPEFLDLMGIDYSNLPTLLSPGIEIDPLYRKVENTEAAIFAELTYQLSDTLSFTAGVRYTEFEFEDRATEKGSTTNLFPLIFGFAGGTATSTPDVPIGISTGTESSTTTKLSLTWQPSADSTFYITLAEGFRRPHPNISALLPNSVDPTDPTIIPEVADSDELWNYELGAKLRLLDDRLHANVALYYIDWQDIQLSATRASDAVPYAANSGDVESYGLEAEFIYYPTINLEMGLNLTFAEAEVSSLSLSQAIDSGALDASPLTTPDKKFSGFAQYAWPLAGGNALFGRVDVQYVDEYPNAFPNIPGPAQIPNPNFAYTDAYTNLNLQVGWESEKLRIVLYGENVTDNNDYVYINPDSFSYNRYRTLRPRTVGLRASWDF